MTQYDIIDPILSLWAKKNGVFWYSEYQDEDVRTFYLNENRRDRVQIGVDAPQDQQVIIRIGQDRQGLSRLNRIEIITSSVSELPKSLDSALELANKWASE